MGRLQNAPTKGRESPLNAFEDCSPPRLHSRDLVSRLFCRPAQDFDYVLRYVLFDVARWPCHLLLTLAAVVCRVIGTQEWDRMNLTHKTNQTRTQDTGVGPHEVDP